MTVARYPGTRRPQPAEPGDLAARPTMGNDTAVPAQRQPGSPHPALSAGRPLRDLEQIRSHERKLYHSVRVTPEDVAAASKPGLAGYGHAGPGELLRVRAGDRITIRIHNGTDSADVPVTGPHVSASGVSDNVFVRVPPGSSHQYDYDVPADQPSGLHWYYPLGERARRSCGRLVGPVVVEGDIDRVPAIAAARDRVLVIDGHGPGRHGAAVPLLRVNGQRQPEIDIRPGEIQRWRVLNAHPERCVWLHAEGHTLHHIGQDGIPFTRARPVQGVMLMPGNRAELLVRATKPGTYRVFAQGYQHDARSVAVPAAELASMVVDGRPIFSRLPRQLVDTLPIPTGPVVKQRTVRVAGDQNGHDGSGCRYLADGREVTLDRWARDSLGTVEDWLVINDDDVQRPVHLLGNPFQVLEVRGAPAGDASWHTDPEIWRDTYRVPPKGQVAIRVSCRVSA
ncbi:multicopper oxidase domain-containing protein [Phytoactinopolyspora alkaliphila]|uniref:Multicopper oxidase domain-containing protein n=1 Tax=Phytoactinopolyspora alkaliphila TaxID=1783498 RepID=A0A6N9YRR9_9ACTN|nr:multicopper oxidase domain-containing protein [Phytoactinopolyspora alkaliphila]NED97672.1 multicopper oxidase domain-containing protein [Phytoactinopolyspora alkaliphila]